ncbi:hypothetical protein [Laspinema olomoucense]|uniref:hypothetical protein n=1 Tax=Laspinema olomoucense TaxID=3231600 RepID=UPI0021BAE4C1|nr:hypothetical protein [Laspinema sp. D3d]MCT7971719.1 hypothetical protein [Laspinema sp. D3d]
MTPPTLEQAASSVPFTLNFVEKINPAVYDQAIQDSQVLKEFYDPATQTSNIPVSAAGTSLTYRDTDSGIFLTRDDSKESDT